MNSLRAAPTSRGRSTVRIAPTSSEPAPEPQGAPSPRRRPGRRAGPPRRRCAERRTGPARGPAASRTRRAPRRSRRRPGVPSRSATSAAGPRSAPSQCPPGTQPCRGERRSATSPDRPDAARRTDDPWCSSTRSEPSGSRGSAPASQSVVGRAPTAASTTSAAISLPSARLTPLVPTSTTCSPVSSRTPAAAYQGAVSSPTVGPSAATSGRAVRLDHHDVDPGRGGDAGDLRADPPRADHDEPRARHERRTEPLGVGGGVQGQGRLPARWPDGVRAAGHDEGVRAQCAVVGRAPRGRAPDSESPRAGVPRWTSSARVEQVGADLVGEPRRTRAVQEVLRQRRAVVRGDPLGAEHHDPPVVAPLPQRRDRLGGRETRPDDEHVTGWSGVRVGRRGSGRSPRNGSLPSGGTSEMVKERMSGAAGVHHAAGAHPRRRRPVRRAPVPDRPVASRRPRPARSPSRGARWTRGPSRVRRSTPPATCRCGGPAPGSSSPPWWRSSSAPGPVRSSSPPSRSPCAVVRAVLPSPGPVARLGAGQGARRRRARPARCGPGGPRARSCRADRDTHGRPGPRRSRASGSCVGQAGVSAP